MNASFDVKSATIVSSTRRVDSDLPRMLNWINTTENYKKKIVVRTYIHSPTQNVQKYIKTIDAWALFENDSIAHTE